METLNRNRLNNICDALRYLVIFLQHVKNTHGGVILLVKFQVCNYTKSITPPWVFFMFVKLQKWY